MVIAHYKRRVVGIAHPADRTVFAVVGDTPEAGLRRYQRLVAVIVVSEGFGRLGEVDLVGHGRNKVFGLFAVRGSLGERRVGFEICETTCGGIVEKVATEVVGAKPEGRILVDRDGRVGVGFASHCHVAGRCARRVLVQVIGLIGRGLGFALLIVGRRRAAVADRVVVEVLRETGDRLAVLRSAGRSQLGAGIVGVGIDRAGEIAERAAASGDGSAAAGGIVGVVELRDDVGRRRVADLDELVVRVVLPGGR